MRWLWCALVVSAACAAPGKTSVHDMAATTPRCPEPVCPQPPATSPLIQQPICMDPPIPSRPTVPPQAEDWYCFDHRPGGAPRSSFCWPSLALCNERRRYGRKNKLGPTSECARQRVAYCIHLTEGRVLVHQDVCTRSLDDCHDVHKDYLKDSELYNVIVPCQPMLNTGYFDDDAGFSERRLRE